MLPHHVFEQRELAVVDEEPHLARFLEIPLSGEERERSEALVMVARHARSGDHSQGAADTVADQMRMGGACNGEGRVDRGHHALATVLVEVDVAVFRSRIAPGNAENGEPLAKFIERGEFSLCSRGGAAGAQAGAGLSCVTRSI